MMLSSDTLYHLFNHHKNLTAAAYADVKTAETKYRTAKSDTARLKAQYLAATKVMPPQEFWEYFTTNSSGDLEVSPGANMWNVIKEILAMANISGEIVSFLFCGTPITAIPDMTEEQIFKLWDTTREKERAEHQNGSM